MKFVKRIRDISGSLGMSIPIDVVNVLKLQEGDIVEVEINILEKNE